MNDRKTKRKRVLSIALVICMLLSNSAYAVADGGSAVTESSKYIKTTAVSKLKPNSEMTQGPLFEMINRSFGYTKSANTVIKGINKSNKYYKQYQIALRAGYFKKGSVAKPTGKITKLQLAIIIADLLNLSQPDMKTPQSFKEEKSLSKVDLAKIQTVIDRGIMAVKGDGSLLPNENITVSDAVQALEKGYLCQIKATYKTAGTYSQKVVTGSVLIDAPNVVLENTEILGDLIIGKNVGDGDVSLKNIIVHGTTTVKGGGMNSVIVSDSQLQNIRVIKENNKVRIVATGTTTVSSVDMASGGKLEETSATGSGFGEVTIAENIDINEPIIFSGAFGKITVEASDANINVVGGTVDSMQLSSTATNAKVSVGDTAVLKGMSLGASVQLSGNGVVEAVEVLEPKLAVDITGTNKIGVVTVASQASDTTFKLGDQVKVAGMVLEAKTVVTGTGSVGTVDISAGGTSIGVKTDTVVADKGVSFTDMKGTVQVGTKDPAAPNLMPDKPLPTNSTGTTGTGTTGATGGGTASGPTTSTKPSTGGSRDSGGSTTPPVTPTITPTVTPPTPTPTTPVTLPVVTEVKVTNLNSLKVVLDKAPVDTTKVQFTVTTGSVSVSVTPTWNTLKTEAILTSGSNLAVGTYRIVASYNGTEMGKKDVAVEAQKIADFNITSKVLGKMDSSTYFATISVQDQYGNDITNLPIARQLTYSVGTLSVWSKGEVITVLDTMGSLSSSSTATIVIKDSVNTSLEKSVVLPVATEIKTLNSISLDRFSSIDNEDLVAGDVPNVFFIEYTAKDINGNETKNFDILSKGLKGSTYGMGANLVCSIPSVRASVVNDVKDPFKAAIQLSLVPAPDLSVDTPFTVTVETLAGEKSTINLLLKKTPTVKPDHWFGPLDFKTRFMSKGAVTTIDFAGEADQKIEVMQVPYDPCDMVRDTTGLKVLVESNNANAFVIGNYGENNYAASAVLAKGDAIEIKSVTDNNEGAYITFKLFKDIDGDNTIDDSELYYRVRLLLSNISKDFIGKYHIEPVGNLYDIEQDPYFASGDVVTAAGKTMGKSLTVYGLQTYASVDPMNFIKLSIDDINPASSNSSNFYIDPATKKIYAKGITGTSATGKISVEITGANGAVKFATADVVGMTDPLLPTDINAVVTALGKDNFTPNTVTLSGMDISISAAELVQLATEGLYYFTANGESTSFDKTAEGVYVENGYFQVVVSDNYSGTALNPVSTVFTQTVDANASTPTSMTVDKDGKITITGTLDAGDEFTMAVNAGWGIKKTYTIKIK